MQEQEYIKQELKEISPLLSSLAKQCPYKDPAGYFNSLPEIILGTVKLTTLTDSSSVYSLPSGYFENFANNILQKIKSQEKKAK